MKKSIKLLSIVMAFAMVMSVVVLPVSAAPTNLAPASVKYGSTNLYNKAEYSFTCLSSNEKMHVRNTPVESGKTYYFSYEVMIKNTTKSIEVWRPEGVSISNIKFLDGTAVNSNGNTTVSLSGNNWYKFEAIGTASGTGNIHFGPRIMCTDTSKTIYFRNPKAYEITAFGVSTDAADVMSVNPVITYSFTNPLKADLAASNFDQDVVVTKVSDTEYTVALSNLDYSTPYTIKMTGVVDVANNALAENTINFTTEGLPVTYPVADDLLASAANTYSKGTATYTKESDGSYTVSVPAVSDGISVGRVELQPGVYIGSVEVMNVNVSGTAKACAERYNITASTDRTVSNVTLSKTGYKTLYTMIMVKTAGTIEVGFKLSQGEPAADACTVKARNFKLRQLQGLDLDNDEYSAVVTKEGSNAALYITGPAASTVYFAAAAYNGEQMTDIKFGKTTLSGTSASKIEIAAGEGYKLFIWDSNLKPLNTTFEVSALK